MEFKQSDLLELAEQFERKAEQFLETATSIRESASLLGTPANGAGPVNESPTKKPFILCVAESDQEKERQDSQEVPPREHADAMAKLESLSPLEKKIVGALWGEITGRSLDWLINVLRGHATKGSIRFACSKLAKVGVLERLGRGRYALVRVYRHDPSFDAPSSVGSLGGEQ